MTNKFILSIAAVFIVLSIAFYVLNRAIPQFNFGVLMTGNGLMALLSIISCFLVKKQVDQRAQAFVRGVYSGTFLKMFVCIIAIAIYALVYKATLHKPTLFVLFGIYAVYTAIETALLMNMAKRS